MLGKDLKQVVGIKIDVREFIQLNYSLYEGDDEFLEGPTKATETLWDQVMQLSKERERGGMWDMDTKVASTITSHDAGLGQRFRKSCWCSN